MDGKAINTANDPVSLSAVIMTFNEEKNIGRCIDSLADLADEILVVDSHSTDETVNIAKSRGARVIKREFPGYPQQRRYAIQHAGFEHIFTIDADEYLSDELRQSIAAVKNNWQLNGYVMNRLNKFGDRWIRYGTWYPDRKLRLFRRDMIEVRDERGHDVMVLTSGRPGKLKGDLLHLTHTDLDQRGFRVNQFSTLAAQSYHRKGKRSNLIRLLFKPIYRFLNEYLFHLGFLDGFYGFMIASTAAQYVFFREAKTMELHRLGRTVDQNTHEA